MGARQNRQRDTIFARAGLPARPVRTPAKIAGEEQNFVSLQSKPSTL
jgi:hypothetical protein